MQIADTYREINSLSRRQFDLYNDHVVVRVKSPNYDATSNIVLRDIRPQPDTFRLRFPQFKYGILMIVAAIPAGLYAYFGTTYLESPVAMVVAFSLAFVGTVISLFTVRKVEYTRFLSHAGVPILDIGRCGPDVARYDEFVRIVTDAIAAAQVQSISPSPPATQP